MVKRYIRQGGCDRCGQCCEEENCEHFQPGDSAMCSIHEREDRPNKCKWYPQLPPIIFDKCTYYFLDTWEDNRVIMPRMI